jgi:hypothetical protein
MRPTGPVWRGGQPTRPGRPRLHALLRGRYHDRVHKLSFALILFTIGLLLTVFAWLNGGAAAANSDTASTAAEVTAGVLAIAVTVVAIVLELAANRYTHRITQMFVREPINAATLGFFVVTTMTCLWVSSSPMTSTGAGAGVWLAMIMATVSLASLLPYFAFLFRFLGPTNTIARIRADAIDSIRMSKGDVSARPTVVRAIRDLEDIARRAQIQRDRSIAMSVVDALGELVRDYLPMRSALPQSWFKISGDLSRDPDFVSLAPSSRVEIESNGTWLETKVLRTHLTLFEDALGTNRDVANLIALNTRMLGERHFEGASDGSLLRLAIRFFNTYLRFSIRAGDIRSAYYVQHQYRLLAERALSAGDFEAAIEISNALLDYSLFAFEIDQPFLLQVGAYELGELVARADEIAPAAVDDLLDVFLHFDRESLSLESAQEETLSAVRREQVSLAAYFLYKGDEPRARKIHTDMIGEKPERLNAVRRGIEAAIGEQYKEFSDRGVNFSWVAPERRAQLDLFYSWFESAD